VVVAGGQVHGARGQQGAVDGLDHGERAEAVEPLGELAGEDRGHVLHEQHRDRQGRRQGRQHLGQGLRAAGGRADDQDGGLLDRTEAGGRRADRRQSGGGGAGGTRGDRAPGERLDLGDQLLADALHGRGDAADVGRLGDVVVGAGGEGVEGG
jgi:hypothetical protein